MTKKVEPSQKFDVSEHSLVPKHTKLDENEINELYEKYNISFKDLPKMALDDPLVAALNAKTGDVIKIERKSMTATISIYYRGVSNV